MYLFWGCFTMLYHAQMNEMLHSRECQRGMFGDHVFEGPKSTLAQSDTQCVSEYLPPAEIRNRMSEMHCRIEDPKCLTFVYFVVFTI